MTNIQQLILPLFLLLPAVIQCMEEIMEEITIAQPRTMQEIRIDRNSIYVWRLRKECKFNCYYGTLDELLFQSGWKSYYNDLDIAQDREPNRFQECLEYEHEGYSALGLVVMAIKNITLIKKKTLCEYEELRNNIRSLIKKPHIHVSFNEKKKYIKKLSFLGIIPNDKDKEMDKLNAWEQAALAKLFLSHSQLLKNIQLPQDVINYISLLISEIRLLP
jgi:hypothetical protein